jgi:hypothetical protein
MMDNNSQKRRTITTSVAIVLGVSLAILGTATIITSYNGMQQAFAASKNCTVTGTSCWCYTTSSGVTCYQNKGDCNKAQKSDVAATRDCSKNVF